MSDNLTKQDVIKIVDKATQEILQAVATGFNNTTSEIMTNREEIKENREFIGENREDIKNNGRKIDGLSNRIDAEIVLRSEEHAQINKRLEKLEEKVFE